MMGFFCGLALGALIGLICLCCYALARDEAPKQTATDTGDCRIFKCSACGYGVEDIFQENEHDYPVGEFNFCPHCGAEIVEEAEQ